MQFEEKNITAVFTQFSLTFSTDEVEVKIEEQLQKRALEARVPGFRKGHVPKEIIRVNFGEKIAKEAIEALASDFSHKIITERNLHCATRPIFSVEKYEPGQDLVLSMLFETYPIIEHKGFKELTIEKLVCSVSDEEFNTILKDFYAAYTKKERVTNRAAQNTDFVTVVMGIFRNGERVHSECHEYVSLADSAENKNDWERVIRENAVGKSIADVISVPFTVPLNSDLKKLQGKAVTLEIVVTSIFEEKPATFDDAEAKAVFEAESLEEFERVFKATLTRIRNYFVDFYNKRSVLAVLDQAYDFDVPPSFVMRDLKRLTPGILHKFQQEEMQKEESVRQTENEYLQQYIPVAEHRVKMGCLIEDLVSKGDFVPTVQDIAELLLNEATVRGMDVEELAASYQNDKDFASEIHWQISENLVVKKVLEEATVTEKVISSDEFKMLMLETLQGLDGPFMPFRARIR
jgi:trigger factor